MMRWGVALGFEYAFPGTEINRRMKICANALKKDDTHPCPQGVVAKYVGFELKPSTG